jgi:hypothetical protein
MNSIPTPVKVIAWILIAFGFVGGAMFLVNPSALIPGFSSEPSANRIAAGMLAGRSAAMAVLLFLALRTNKPALLLPAFVMRLITESVDLISNLANGNTSPSALGPIVLPLLLEIYCIAVLARAQSSESRSASPAQA